MATAKTAKAKSNEIPASNPDADVHHMIRSVGTNDMPDGTISVDTANEHVRNWLQAGYTLQHIETLEAGIVSQTGHYRAILLYVFVK